MYSYLTTVIAFVDDIIIPVSWYNIDENSKNMRVRRFQDLSDTITYKIVPIEINNHTADTLTDAVQMLLTQHLEEVCLL